MANPIVRENQSIPFVSFTKGVSPTILSGDSVTLTVHESGSLIFVKNEEFSLITLPPATPEIEGCTYTFIQISQENSNSIVIDCGAPICYGTAVLAGAATVSGVGVQYARFLHDASQAGDSISLTCNGALWFGYGFSSNDAGIEFAN